ncbi:MAG: hypothetical protein IPL32_15430 [Chloracidobacterium sp.]|nr:hypothetical protein [Chloracidobacterium sp.]
MRLIDRVILILSFFVLGVLTAFGQGADGKPIFGNLNECESLERNLRGTCITLRIKREEKEHEEMLERAEEVLRLSDRLEKSFAQNGNLSQTDRAALEAVEKAVKKIRSELGGDGDDEKIDDILPAGKNASFADAVDTLKTFSASLVEELKKTSRLTISATAIQTSNAVLTVTRFLRIKN